MNTNFAETKITFTMSGDGWAGEFRHFGEVEYGSGADLDSLMAQLATWLENAPLAVEPEVVAFGAPVLVQSPRIMRSRIEHEWIMEREAHGERSPRQMAQA